MAALVCWGVRKGLLSSCVAGGRVREGLLSSWVDGGRESCWDGDESPWAAGAGKDPLLFWAVRMGRGLLSL